MAGMWGYHQTEPMVPRRDPTETSEKFLTEGDRLPPVDLALSEAARDRKPGSQVIAHQQVQGLFRESIKPKAPVGGLSLDRTEAVGRVSTAP